MKKFNGITQNIIGRGKVSEKKIRKQLLDEQKNLKCAKTTLLKLTSAFYGGILSSRSLNRICSVYKQKFFKCRLFCVSYGATKQKIKKKPSTNWSCKSSYESDINSVVPTYTRSHRLPFGETAPVPHNYTAVQKGHDMFLL